MLDQIRDLIDRHAGLATPAAQLAVDADLFSAGMNNFDGVRLMMAIEDAFEIEFPERMFCRANFASIEAIALSIADVVPDKLKALVERPRAGLERAA